jgi:hypothetical protein
MTLDEMISDIDYVVNKSQLATLELGDESTKQLLHWLEDYKHLQSVSSWIPCSERMPEKDTSVLISAQGHRVSAFYDSVKGVFMLTETEGLFYSMSAVTHWMPIPSPPEVTNNVD